MPYRLPRLFRRPRYSPLTMRILAVNVLALLMLGGGMLFLGQYQARLMQAELDGLTFEAKIFASALSEGAVLEIDEDNSLLAPELARSMVRRLIEISDSRMRLFDDDGTILADSRLLTGRGGKIQIEALPPLAASASMLIRYWQRALDWLGRALAITNYPPYRDSAGTADQEPLAQQALQGMTNTALWRLPQERGIMLGVAVPVQDYKKVLGAVMLTRPSTKIDQALAAVRGDVLKLFLAVMSVTILLSLYLARTIAVPLQTLARAVRDVNQNQATIAAVGGTAALLASRQIPDMTDRGDEVGDLSRALRDMTTALATRLTAIEHFAADVAHELKNPLTSLRSAVETVARVHDPAMVAKLMGVIQVDVQRMDRLITDIADASRLDAELSRAALTPTTISIKTLLETIVAHYHCLTVTPDTVVVELTTAISPDWHIQGVEDRLVQVLRNLIENACSFTPRELATAEEAKPSVRISVAAAYQAVHIMVDDDGIGIPPTKLETIFERFYTERPSGEKFGQHSGLGLSIARQIVEAHNGRLWAENRIDSSGAVLGARFTLALPLIA